MGDVDEIFENSFFHEYLDFINGLLRREFYGYGYGY